MLAGLNPDPNPEIAGIWACQAGIWACQAGLAKLLLDDTQNNAIFCGALFTNIRKLVINQKTTRSGKHAVYLRVPDGMR